MLPLGVNQCLFKHGACGLFGGYMSALPVMVRTVRAVSAHLARRGGMFLQRIARACNQWLPTSNFHWKRLGMDDMCTKQPESSALCTSEQYEGGDEDKHSSLLQLKIIDSFSREGVTGEGLKPGILAHLKGRGHSPAEHLPPRADKLKHDVGLQG
eukprot:1159089-Pelagomonas_calceolata.AAC.19